MECRLKFMEGVGENGIGGEVGGFFDEVKCVVANGFDKRRIAERLNNFFVAIAPLPLDFTGELRGNRDGTGLHF